MSDRVRQAPKAVRFAGKADVRLPCIDCDALLPRRFLAQSDAGPICRACLAVRTTRRQLEAIGHVSRMAEELG